MSIGGCAAHFAVLSSWVVSHGQRASGRSTQRYPIVMSGLTLRSSPTTAADCRIMHRSHAIDRL